MKPDDELCLCFHVSWRKVINYIRVHRVRKPSLLNECGGAGTGCGWCRKQLTRLTELVNETPPSADSIEEWLADHSPGKAVYASGREAYRTAIAAGASSDSALNHTQDESVTKAPPEW